MSQLDLCCQAASVPDLCCAPAPERVYFSTKAAEPGWLTEHRTTSQFSAGALFRRDPFDFDAEELGLRVAHALDEARRPNLVDELGFVHNHEVPAEGQFRLKSACRGCDQNYDATVAS